MNEDIVTVSYQNGHYEVYDHTKNETWVKTVFPNGNSSDLDASDVYELVEKIVTNYEWKSKNIS